MLTALLVLTPVQVPGHAVRPANNELLAQLKKTMAERYNIRATMRPVQASRKRMQTSLRAEDEREPVNPTVLPRRAPAGAGTGDTVAVGPHSVDAPDQGSAMARTKEVTERPKAAAAVVKARCCGSCGHHIVPELAKYVENKCLKNSVG